MIQFHCFLDGGTSLIFWAAVKSTVFFVFNYNLSEVEYAYMHFFIFTLPLYINSPKHVTGWLLFALIKIYECIKINLRNKETSI